MNIIRTAVVVAYRVNGILKIWIDQSSHHNGYNIPAKSQHKSNYIRGLLLVISRIMDFIVFRGWSL